MLTGLFRSTNIPVLQQVVQFAEARHDVLASNVANLDTPGYRVRDLSVTNFQDRLREAIDIRNQQGQPISSGYTAPPAADPIEEVSDSVETILFHDNSNVGLEQQVTELSKNQYMHNLAITILSHQFRLLEAAVTERA